MKHAKEVKVGVAIIVASALFFIGIRFFEDVPIFRGTYELFTEFENAQGLTTGNAVRVRGVSVGAVEAIDIRTDGRGVRVRFHVDRRIRIPEGSTASVSGIAALNGVRLELNLGPVDNPHIPPEGFVEGSTSATMDDLTARAPEIIDRFESVLDGASATFARIDHLLLTAEPELSASLQSVRRVSESLDRTVSAQQVRLSTTMENLEEFSHAMRTFANENNDSLSLLISQMNESFARLGTNLALLEESSRSLNRILAGIESGDGTAGRLVSDATLYEKLDSTLDAMNRLLLDFQEDPKRYLESIRLIDIF